MFLYAKVFIAKYLPVYVCICTYDYVSKQLSAGRMHLYINLFILFRRDQLFALVSYGISR